MEAQGPRLTCRERRVGRSCRCTRGAQALGPRAPTTTRDLRGDLRGSIEPAAVNQRGATWSSRWGEWNPGGPLPVGAPVGGPQKSQSDGEPFNGAPALKKRRRPFALWGSQHPFACPGFPPISAGMDFVPGMWNAQISMR
jgi:hypothetical protein